jgi:FkbM family methyltransferase
MSTTLSSSRLRDTLLEAHERSRDSLLFSLPAWTREQRPPTGSPIVLLGSNHFASMFIVAAGQHPVAAVVDDFKVGQTIEGVRVISSVELLRLATRCPDLICVNTSRWDLSRRYFASLSSEFQFRLLTFEQGVRYFGLEDIDFRCRDWGPVIRDRLDEYLQHEDALYDECSRETLYSVLLFHLTTDAEFYLHVARPYETLYFRSGLFRLGQKEAFVDCGASIGESITHFLGITGENFAHACCVEPDKLNLPKLQAIKDRYFGTPAYDRIQIFGKALGAQKSRVAFQHEGGHGGRVLEGIGDVELDALDDFVNFDPTFLKMDIEGFEVAALTGGSQLISSARPKIAVSAYHRADDFIEITRLITSLNPNYRIGLRHHNMERWDTCLYFFED